MPNVQTATTYGNKIGKHSGTYRYNAQRPVEMCKVQYYEANKLPPAPSLPIWSMVFGPCRFGHWTKPSEAAQDSSYLCDVLYSPLSSTRFSMSRTVSISFCVALPFCAAIIVRHILTKRGYCNRWASASTFIWVLRCHAPTMMVMGKYNTMNITTNIHNSPSNLSSHSTRSTSNL